MRLAALLLIILLAGCGAEPGSPVVGTDAAPETPTETPTTNATPSADRSDPAATDDGRVWFEVLGVSQAAPSGGELNLATTEADVAVQWRRHGMDGDAPALDLDTLVMLFVGRGDDNCPDQLIAVTETDGVLETTWLPPAGGCEQPYIPTGHAVALHRGDLGQQPTIALRDQHDGDTVATFDLPPHDGPPAPPPPDVPTQPGEDEVAAIFDGHPLQPCSDLTDPLDVRGQVDGPTSDEPDVAEAQQQRADVALPSDRDTVVSLLSDPANLERGFGFPLSQPEFDELMSRGNLAQQEELEAYLADHRDTLGFRYLSQVRGGLFVIGFTEGVDARRAELAEAFPALAVDVVPADSTEEERQAIVDVLFAALPSGADAGPTLSHGAAGLHRAEIGLIEPTRADLDAVAALVVDPSLVCISPEFRGIRRG